jgi:hypothetical protein
MSFNAPPQLMANGNIYPSRFVQVDTTAANKCVQATANSKIIGVVQAGTNYPPLNDPAVTVSGYAATAGQTVELFGIGQVCLIEAGDVITPADFLKSDSVGRGVPILTTGTTLQRYGAIALEAATAAGQFIRCYVILGSERPALT